jgi:citrate lyase beta subunit
MTDGSRMADLASAVALADERRLALRDELEARRVRLPLRYWRQQAHFTTPAERDIARKALTAGTAPMSRILERFDVTPADLAERLGVAPHAVEALLERPRRSPMVMVDAEDALAYTAEAVERGRADAIDVLASEDPSGPAHASLRFFRPPGLGLGSTAGELFAVLWGLVDRCGAEGFPLDGIVFPKLEHPEEVGLVHDMLTDAERRLGIVEGTVRTAYLIESGWAASQVAAIATRAADRLCALIFGLADYSADLGLPAIANDHPIADWARAEIVNVAAGIGVPAIDGMTLEYPVADPALDASANRERFLERMALVHGDALRARRMGMLGKWVGHPAQLFAVLLAFDDAFTTEGLETEAAKLRTYAAVVEGGKGATMIGGIMSDRATDRHARALLRQATALGRFDPRRAAELGVIDAAELAEVEGTGVAGAEGTRVAGAEGTGVAGAEGTRVAGAEGTGVAGAGARAT